MAHVESRTVRGRKPDFFHEAAARAAGSRFVAGVDEVGRGPLAGPVVAAAVILDSGNIPAGINDSKKLSATKRELLFSQILVSATVSVVAAPPAIIARLNIRGATLWAMRHAVLGLAIAPDHILIDGNALPSDLPASANAIIGGDGVSLSIAAASIIAKVTRDRMCLLMDAEFPDFGFAGHKGYGTAKHMGALDAHGPCRHHRMEFAPCATAARLHLAR